MQMPFEQPDWQPLVVFLQPLVNQLGGFHLRLLVALWLLFYHHHLTIPKWCIILRRCCVLSLYYDSLWPHWNILHNRCFRSHDELLVLRPHLWADRYHVVLLKRLLLFRLRLLLWWMDTVVFLFRGDEALVILHCAGFDSLDNFRDLLLSTCWIVILLYLWDGLFATYHNFLLYIWFFRLNRWLRWLDFPFFFKLFLF